ncbi:O-antigen ligase family protein, partial [bacterium]|nr:O-antigen ligase family protein [candidate division CSSED10-310 bacterium]
GRFRLAIVVSLTGAGMGLAAVVRLVYRIAILGYGTGIGFRVWPMDTPPNYASFHMLAVIPLSLLILVPRARGWKRVLAAIPAAFMALYVIISYARISWAGLFVEAVVIALLLFGRRVVKGILSPRRVLLAAVILVLAWSAAPGSFKQRFVEGFQPGREPRFDVWRDVAAIVRDYPWLGTGLDTKRYVLPQYQAERRPFEPVTGQYLLDAHSTYVELASAAGLPALAAFVWLLFSAAAGARMLARRQRTLAVAALAALTAVSLDGFFNFRLLLPVNAYLFWMVVGIGLMQGPAILERCRPRRLVTATGLLVMLAAVLFAHLERANRALIYRGLHIIQSGADHVNGKRALGRFLTARALMPMDAHSAYLVGVWHENFGNSDEALRWYRKTLERNPSSALYCDTTGALLMAAGEYEAAEPLLRRANELEPYRQGGVYRRRLATLYLATGRLDEALAQLTTATLIAPDTVNALAEILNGRGGTPWNEVLCARAATVALDLHLDHPALSELLYRRTATAYEAAGLPARSLDMYRHMYKFFGRYTVMHLPLSRLFWRMDRRELALAVLQVRIYQAPRDGVVYNELGVRRFQMGEMEEAEAAFRAALRHWPSIVMDNHLAYQYLVLIARQRGNREMERKALRRLRFVTGGLDHQLWEFKYHFADMFGEVGQYQAYKVAISP